MNTDALLEQFKKLLEAEREQTKKIVREEIRAETEPIKKQLENQGKQLAMLQTGQQEQGKDINILKAVQQEQGKDINILKAVQQEQGKDINNLKAVQQEQGKDINILKAVQQEQGKVINILKAVQQEQGKDINILKTGLIVLERGQNQTHTIVKAIRAGLDDKATKTDIEKIELFIGKKVLDRLDRHNERIEDLERHANFSYQN